MEFLLNLSSNALRSASTDIITVHFGPSSDCFLSLIALLEDTEECSKRPSYLPYLVQVLRLISRSTEREPGLISLRVAAGTIANAVPILSFTLEASELLNVISFLDLVGKKQVPILKYLHFQLCQCNHYVFYDIL